jgi:hypothetical protein
MVDPAEEAANTACNLLVGGSKSSQYAYAVTAARKALEPVRAKWLEWFYAFKDMPDPVLSEFLGDLAPLIFPTEELETES